MGRVKVVLYTPIENAAELRDVIGSFGAGKIGSYGYCSFSSTGIGRFKPLEGAVPSIGEIGQIEEVAEEKIEFVCEEETLQDLVTEIKKAHPYEEVPIEMYRLIELNN